ncbi:putative TLD [Trypanosoma vivax]|nr:putative TLD [Trypanosoma vivax]
MPSKCSGASHVHSEDPSTTDSSFTSHTSFLATGSFSETQAHGTVHQLRLLESCVGDSVGDVTAATTFVMRLESQKHCADCSGVLGWWRKLEAREEEISGLFNACYIAMRQQNLRSLCVLSLGAASAAQILALKQRLLACISAGSEESKERGLKPLLGGDSPSEAAEFSNLLLRKASLQSILCKRKVEFLDKAMSLQQDLFSSAREESEAILSPDETRGGNWLVLGGFWRFIKHTLIDSEKSANESRLAGAGRTHSKNARWVELKSADHVLTDLKLMSLVFQCAFLSASHGHTFVAVSHFALVMYLFATKCNTLEEMLEALTCEMFDGSEMAPRAGQAVGQIESQREETGREYSLILSSICGKVLRRDFFYDCWTPPWQVAAVFATLLWNGAYCLWKRGCIKEAYEWLRTVDIECLQRVEEAVRRWTKSPGTSAAGESTCRNDGEEVRVVEGEEGAQKAENCFHLSWSSLPQSSADSLSRRSRESSAVWNARSDHGASSMLPFLTHRIACLRDVSAIALHCKCPVDILYIVSKFNHALRWQWRRFECEDKTSTTSPVKSQAELSVLETADCVLSLMRFVVENYLARRAVRQYHCNYSLAVPTSPNSQTQGASMTIDDAVRSVCNELIRQLSVDTFFSIADVEQGVPPEALEAKFSVAPVDVGDAEKGSETTGSAKVLKFNWITMRVFGIILRFSSSYRSNIHFHHAWVVKQEKRVREERRGKSEKRGYWNSLSRLASTVHGSAMRYVFRGDELADSRHVPHESSRKNGYDEHLQEHRRNRLGCLLPVTSAQHRNEVGEEGGRCVLWFPSKGGVGLYLLVGEVAGENEYSDSEETALRLLTIACRYANGHDLVSLSSFTPSGRESKVGMSISRQQCAVSDEVILRSVTDELNRAVSILVSELYGRVGPAYVEAWKQQRDMNISRICINQLMELVVRGAHPNTARLINYQVDEETWSTEDESLMEGWEATDVDDQTALLASAEGVESILTGAATLWNAGDGEGTNIYLCESGEVSGATVTLHSTFTPDITFDLSAFRAEALYTTQKLVQELSEREKNWEEAVINGLLMPPDCESSVSIISFMGRRVLHEELPVLWQFSPWKLIYSTRFHGSSYSNMLATCQREVSSKRSEGKKTKMILLMEVDNSTASPGEHRGVDDGARLVIGACLSDPIATGSVRFYGGSTTFVFQLHTPSMSIHPQICVYHATGDNEKYISCTPQRLAIGGGGGCSIFLDNTLSHGSTAKCATFGSPPLSLWSGDTSCERVLDEEAPGLVCSFDIRTLEVIVVE